MQANGHWKEMLLSQVAELRSAVRVEVLVKTKGICRMRALLEMVVALRG